MYITVKESSIDENYCTIEVSADGTFISLNNIWVYNARELLRDFKGDVDFAQDIVEDMISKLEGE